MPPAMERANARKPPITIPIVVKFRNASAVMVAPTDNPKKMVAAFMMLFDAASNQAECIGSDLFDQVTEHQHTD